MEIIIEVLACTAPDPESIGFSEPLALVKLYSCMPGRTTSPP